MNKKRIEDHMISFIEEQEKQLQIEKLASNNKLKKDIVKSILDELEKECTQDED